MRDGPEAGGKVVCWVEFGTGNVGFGVVNDSLSHETIAAVPRNRISIVFLNKVSWLSFLGLKNIIKYSYEEAVPSFIQEPLTNFWECLLSHPYRQRIAIHLLPNINLFPFCRKKYCSYRMPIAIHETKSDNEKFNGSVFNIPASKLCRLFLFPIEAGPSISFRSHPIAIGSLIVPARSLDAEPSNQILSAGKVITWSGPANAVGGLLFSLQPSDDVSFLQEIKIKLMIKRDSSYIKSSFIFVSVMVKIFNALYPASAFSFVVELI